MGTKKMKKGFFERFAQKVSLATGSTPAILIAFAIILVWAATGPIFDYSETWQLVINTGTTIVTFLMVFLIQKSQNRDSVAVQMKLNEILAATESASNRLIDAEDLSEDELKLIQNYYIALKKKAIKENSLRKTHSIDEENGSENLESDQDDGSNQGKKSQ